MREFIEHRLARLRARHEEGHAPTDWFHLAPQSAAARDPKPPKVTESDVARVASYLDSAHPGRSSKQRWIFGLRSKSTGRVCAEMSFTV
jgi:hypothetical protein